MSIEVNNESGLEVDEAAIQRLATFALDQMHVHPEAELAIVFVDEAAMEQLHVQWMDEPGPTDVLSFPIDGPGPAEGPRELGDVFICPEHTENVVEAAVHGVLHLCGYDHETDRGEMLDLQRRVLAGLR